jgi:hypothetical protein
MRISSTSPYRHPRITDMYLTLTTLDFITDILSVSQTILTCLIEQRAKTFLTVLASTPSSGV